MNLLPFQIADDALAYILSTLTNAPAGEYDAALVWSPHGTDGDVEIGQHFMVGYYDKGKRPADSFFLIGEHPVSIMETTLEHLRAKTLHLTSCSIRSKHINLLVASQNA